MYESVLIPLYACNQRRRKIQNIFSSYDSAVFFFLNQIIGISAFTYIFYFYEGMF